MMCKLEVTRNNSHDDCWQLLPCSYSLFSYFLSVDPFYKGHQQIFFGGRRLEQSQYMSDAPRSWFDGLNLARVLQVTSVAMSKIRRYAGIIYIGFCDSNY